MIKKQLLPVGIEDFSKLRTADYYYIDKTGLIKDLLNNPGEVTLFTRPRRFGKSLNMSMLRHFFEIGADPALFNGLQIAAETDLFSSHQGQYPVISISLKGAAGLNFADATASLAAIIRTEALRHQYLMQSDRLSNYDKMELEPLLLNELSKDTLQQSILVLTRLLHIHHNQKVVILVDEYDVPLAKAFEYGYYDQMVMLLRNILHQALKTNDHLQFAVLTGCMRIAKESIFTGLNNLRIHSITSKQFDEYFGFTDAEVKDMLSYYSMESQFTSVKAWYDGYQFGGVSVYCPWDVINYVADLRHDPLMTPQNYWSNTSGNDIIRRFLDKADDTTRWELEQLIEGKSIEKQVYNELTYAEVDKSIDHLWSVLLTTGYLSARPANHGSPLSSYEVFGSGLLTNTLSLKIPNEEIRSIFKNHIYSWFNEQVKTNAARYEAFTQAFIDGNAQQIQDMFSAYLLETISIRDTSVKRSMKENFYHGILLGILKFRRDWIVRSNQESGEGYNDIMIMHNGKRIGIVIEVKYADTANLASECQAALAQIEDLHYTEALKEHDPVKIYKYAIACYKKQCRVEMMEELRGSNS